MVFPPFLSALKLVADNGGTIQRVKWNDRLLLCFLLCKYQSSHGSWFQHGIINILIVYRPVGKIWLSWLSDLKRLLLMKVTDRKESRRLRSLIIGGGRGRVHRARIGACERTAAHFTRETNFLSTLFRYLPLEQWCVQ